MARLVLRLSPVPSSVPQCRQRVRDWLDAAGVEIDRAARDAVLVVVPELVTNGGLHNGSGTIAVRAERLTVGLARAGGGQGRRSSCPGGRGATSSPARPTRAPCPWAS